jgi:chromosome partitioning protein
LSPCANARILAFEIVTFLLNKKSYMFTIASISQKGGGGKTNVVKSLAVAIERSGKKAAILDMDPQASAALWAKRREAEHPEVIPTLLPLLPDALRAAEASVDFALIDTPPKSADVAVEAAKAADLVLITLRPQIEDIETLPATRRILDLAGDKPAIVILNATPPNRARIEEVTALITGHETAPFPVCPHTLGNLVAFGDASILGLTPQEYEPKGKAAEEIEQVYKYVYDIVRKLRSEKNGKTKHNGRDRAEASA